jgi:hypothetical protein
VLAVPTPVPVDSNGQVTIVTRVEDVLHCPVYSVSCPNASGPAQTFKVHAAQRALERISKVKTGDDLITAKSTTGNLIFDQSSSKKDVYGSAASLLSTMPSALNAVDPSVAAIVPSPRNSILQDVTFTWPPSGDNWWEKALNVAEQLVGDVFEFIKNVARTAFRYVFRIVNKVLSFIVEIEGRVFIFVRAVILYKRSSH